MTKHVIARSRTTIVLVAAAIAAWAVTVDRMRGMDAGPGTDLGGLGWYLGIWVTMTAAMMLPSTATATRHIARPGRRASTVLFAAGYLAVWSGYGLLAYGVFRLVTSFDIGWLAWDRGGPYAAGGVIVAAGLYELTPLKRLGLRRCRSAPYGGNAFRIGLAHGLDCVGCSGGLMAVLFALGAMSLFWMAVVAVAIFAEKVLPRGPRLTPVFAVALVALGILVAVSPASVPGLTEPGGSPRTGSGFNVATPKHAEEVDVRRDELHGLSAFALEDGVVYHTYSCYDRGTDVLSATWQLLDRTPKGRGDDPEGWPRRQDEYE